MSLLYFDANALVKAYAEERGTRHVVNLFNAAERVFTSKVAYAEVLMTLRRKKEEGGLTENELSSLARAFERDWLDLIAIELSRDVLDVLRDRIMRYPLKALDALHLSSALWLRDFMRTNAIFVCSDKRLLRIAVAERLETIDPSEEESS